MRPKFSIEHSQINSNDTIIRPDIPLGSKCVIGLERDGVINNTVVPYCYRIEDFNPISGSLDAITKLRLHGYQIVVITDQGGIEKGMYAPADVDRLHEHMLMLLGQAGCPSIDAIYYSASSRREDMYAKPNTGMFDRCEAEMPFIKFKNGFYVGTSIKDLKVALRIGATPVLVRSGANADVEKDLNKYSYRKLKEKTLIFDNLEHFANSMCI
jgi:D-glycero-D-manno-heptose 1,7-bisphosphate phosphatase